MNTRRTGTILDEIVAQKMVRLTLQKAKMPIAKLTEEAQSAPAPRDFLHALKEEGKVSLIAEVKKASPVKGILRDSFDPSQLSRAYQRAGASAISVITEQDFFLGSPDYLTQAHEAASLPILRKDFIFDPYQVYESRAIRADALLIIAGILEDSQLADLAALTAECGMTPLVEVHDEEEVGRAVDCDARVVGINNRNLKTMSVDISTTARLLPLLPKETTVVAESGIRSRDDMQLLESLGVDGALVGEAIMRAADVESMIRQLLGEEQRPLAAEQENRRTVEQEITPCSPAVHCSTALLPLVKICGITNLEDARAAVDCGADMLGFVFAPSARCVSPETVARITSALPRGITRVGVFVDAQLERVGEIAQMCNLDLAQLHGSETKDYARRLTIPFVKAFRAQDESVLSRIADFGADTFLLDSYHPDKPGGTGRKLDLTIAARASRLGRMILAGGLNPDNVAEAVIRANPYAVDVSSGVELSPGKKDHGKIRMFITEAKRCARR